MPPLLVFLAPAPKPAIPGSVAVEGFRGGRYWPGWRHRWGLHEARYSGIPFHVPVLAAALHVVAAVAALGAAYVLLRGYRVARDRGMLWASLGLLLISMASLTEACLYMGLPGPSAITVADGLYVLGYVLILYPSRSEGWGGAGAPAVGLLAGVHFLGSLVAGLLALWLSFSSSLGVGAAFLVLAVSHFLDSVIALLGLYTPVLVLAAAITRIIGLNILLIVLLMTAARVERSEGREEA